jgi:transcriptional regulator with XRE-family HTH domain
MFKSNLILQPINNQGNGGVKLGLTSEDLKRLSKRNFTVKQLALSLGITPSAVYKILSGQNRLLPEHIVKLIYETKDTELINHFLAPADHIAIPVKFRLNGKWDDEFHEIIKNLGELAKALAKNDVDRVMMISTKIIKLVAQLSEEVQNLKQKRE